MAIRQLATNNKGALYQCTVEATDLGPLTLGPAAGFAGTPPTASTTGNFLTAFNDGDQIIAEDTGRFWRVGRDTSNNKILILQNTGSATPGSAAAADIVYVVAQAAKYGAVPMSSFVFGNIPAAVSAAATVGGATVMLLDDTYTLGATLVIPNNVRLTGLSQSASAVTITTSGAFGSSIDIAAGATAALSSLTIAPNAADTAIRCAGFAVLDLDRVTVSQVGAVGLQAVVGQATVTCRDSSIGGTTALASSIDNSVFSFTDSSLLGDVTVTGAAVSMSLTDSSVIGSFSLLGAGSSVEVSSAAISGTFTSTSLRSATTRFTAAVSIVDGLVDQGSTFQSTLAFGAISTLNNSRVGLAATGGASARINAATFSSDLTVTTNANITGTYVGGAVVAGDGSTFLHSTSVGTFSASGFASIKSIHTGRVFILASGTPSDMLETFVRVTGLAGGQGAIDMSAVGSALTVSGFVQGNQNIAISGSGSNTVTVVGEIRGGCRITGVTVAPSVSGVRGNQVGPGTGAAGTIPAATTQDIATTTGVTRIVDTVRADPLGVGATLEIYATATLPNGFLLTVRNEQSTVGPPIGLTVAASVGDLIDGVATRVVGPGDFVSLQKIALNEWRTV